MKRRRPKAEAREMGQFMRRVARAMTRRVGEGELDALVELLRTEQEVRVQVDACLLAAVDVAAYSQGFIARELGVSQQAVQKRIRRARQAALEQPAPEVAAG